MLIAGAPAEISFQAVTNFFTRRMRIAIDDLRRGHDHSGRAIAALQSMLLPEAFLHRMQFAIRSQTFDGRDIRAVCLDRKHRARLYSLPVENHRACAADGSLAADVRAG